MSLVPAEDFVEESKYVVRKASGEILAPGTYFVVKATDLFASAGLWSYAHSMQAALEMADERPGFLTEQESTYLRNLADRAAHLAGTWERNRQGRLPD
jgi:putative SOS response-associated peptidase YedK